MTNIYRLIITCVLTNALVSLPNLSVNAEIYPSLARKGGVKDMHFENKHTLRVAIREDEEDLYLTRANFVLDFTLPYFERAIEVLPFFEYQYNLDSDSWWRKEGGLEIGASFFNDWFYYGASFQHVWQQEENYPVESLGETTEWESRFELRHPINWGIFKDGLKLRIFDEYTYDFTRGQGTRNDAGVTLEWQILEGLRLPLGWRHIDRVHDYDSDTLEFSLLFIF